MFWRPIEQKPTEPGIYVVAEFNGDKMVHLSTDWARTEEGYWGPNSAAYCGRMKITHWMPYRDYRRALELLPRY